MATEEELHKKLGKLEITHNMPQIKFLDSNLPVQSNPFFEFEIKDTGPENSAEQKLITQGTLIDSNRTPKQNCRRCRFRRVSESVLDELKHASSNTSDSVECTRTQRNGGLKQTLKRTTTSTAGGVTNRKVLLREPVLKALQTCLHPHSNVRRKLLASAVNTKASANNDVPLTTKGMSDFRDLIDECRNLLLEDVDFSGRLNQLCLSNRNAKNFTTMQTPKIQSNKLRNINPVLNTAILSLSSAEKTTLNEDQLNGHAMSSIQQQSSSSYISSTVQQRNGVLSPEQLTNPVRCNTSCSQQAGNSAAAATCDDVSIDELACYFDTFVHIPKKMSSMAEMMYI